MSIDDLRTIEAGSPIETDICLIGSGPAGWAIAEELKNSGLRILMLESGGHVLEPATDALNETEDVGTALFNGRSRVVGGTSRVWGGRCMPFDDIDYEKRPWVARSGWPFGAKTMAPYVNRASEHLNAGPYYDGCERRSMAQGRRPRPNVDPALMRSTWWENPSIIDFGQVLRTQRGANLWVLVCATVTHLNTDPSGRQIRSVEVSDLDGRRLTVHAQVVVLCAGGIENARILLYSNRLNPAGVGNPHDTVGRYLIDHPRDFSLIARVERTDANQFREWFGPHRLDNGRGRHEFNHGFVLSPERQRADGLLNTAAWPYEVLADDNPFDAARRLAKGPRNKVLHDVGLVAFQSGLLLREVKFRLATGQRVRQKVERIGFLVSSEQVPDPDSRVQLSDRCDRFGLPISRTNWRVSELEVQSQVALAQSIASEFARLGLPPIQLADWVRDGGRSNPHLVDGCHPSGTTRISEDAYSGVVDANCQVHGVDGLYAAGSSVFPTNGHANPTLMIVALAVRLSKHLQKRLAVRTEAAVRPQRVLASASSGLT